MMLTKTIIC